MAVAVYARRKCGVLVLFCSDQPTGHTSHPYRSMNFMFEHVDARQSDNVGASELEHLFVTQWLRKAIG